MVVFLASNLAGDSCCEEILHVIVVDVVEVNLVLALLKVVLNVGGSKSRFSMIGRRLMLTQSHDDQDQCHQDHSHHQHRHQCQDHGHLCLQLALWNCTFYKINLETL